MTSAQFPDQSQKKQPGEEKRMRPQPETMRTEYIPSGKLRGKVAIITGGDSGIGRSIAMHYAAEGASVAIVYYNEDEDAEETSTLVESLGGVCILLRGDVKDKSFCKKCIQEVIAKFGKINILVNNAAVQFPEDTLQDVSQDHMVETFQTNIFSFIYMTQLALPHMHKGDRVINTTSVTAYRGSDHLIDYASTKGAIVSFTRSLAKNLAPSGILVNGVAPGPIWTPLIPATFDDVSEFGSDTPLGRAGQPSEVAPAYVFLASEDSTYITGQIIHVNGGEVVGG
ncbi:SDR family oxidoreductase [Reichenbachiella agarivorans]|uniref:SDR family oxidoreductase n=1 Tax=Reichenbachiella agarivorans TaxID=2979464 RepID=A0ABY6CY36_9BACT|nr:SDR family oxidoreductase [Reichenbachiella agarivorans]UXP33135.1 SDR family oxidoreductase [Reichenbachiella agarivorans]